MHPKFLGTAEYPLHASSLHQVLRCPWRVASKCEIEPEEAEESEVSIDVVRVEAKLPKLLARESKRKKIPRLRRKRRKR
jgi:hypothetical protein